MGVADDSAIGECTEQHERQDEKHSFKAIQIFPGPWVPFAVIFQRAPFAEPAAPRL
jgi:hypothetical protein